MRLHEQTQRFILLLIFYLFGPILTLGIIGGIAVRKLPSNARNWERTLSRQTGIPWKIQTVEFRSLGFVRLHNVKLFNENEERPLFQAEQIDIRLLNGNRQETLFPGLASPKKTHTTGLTGWFLNSFPAFDSADQFWQITVPFSIADFGKFSSEQSVQCVQNLLHKLFVRLETFAEVPVQFVLEEIAVVSEYSLKKQGNKTEDKIDLLRFVQGNIYRTPREIRSDWSFQVKDVSEFDREYLSFSLSESLQILFRTGTQPVPCDFAAVFCGMFKHFSGGTFQGEFQLSLPPGGQTPTVRFNQAVFKNVPLAPLLRSYTDIPITGTLADLQLHQAEFGAGNTYAEGNLQVVHGTIAMPLLHRCVDKFQLTVRPSETLDYPVQSVPFSACVIHFRLQPQGIDFWADDLWRDGVIHHPGDSQFPHWTVYLPPNRRTVTYHELMSIFVPDSAPVVPLTQGMQSLLPHIPVK